MKYIMITNWQKHWNDIYKNRSLFTESMFRNGMNVNLIKNGTATIFIKKTKGTGQVEKAWRGHVFNLEKSTYKDSPAIAFTVDIKKEIACPKKYLHYKEGWYPEESSKPDRWEAIENEYHISKRTFGKKINFVNCAFKRMIIFRDVEQAQTLLEQNFDKPALVLAGGVIEELLRLYLQYKNIPPERNTFEKYIKACKDNYLLKASISNLSDSARLFRNMIHLECEKIPKHTISRATAKMVVASIFTIINDF